MSLVRMLARPMLASIFVIQGAAAMKNPEMIVPRAKPVTDTLVPALKRVAPAAVADRIPEDPKKLVRINGAVHLVGGLALAAGRFPRVGGLMLLASMVPTTWAGHAFWQEEDPEQRYAQRVHLLKNVTMTGGLLLAVVDTDGKPSLWWRARHGAREARHETGRAAKVARGEARWAARLTRREARHGAREIKAKLPH